MDGDEHDAGLLEPEGMGRIERKKEIMKTKQEGEGDKGRMKRRAKDGEQRKRGTAPVDNAGKRERNERRGYGDGGGDGGE